MATNDPASEPATDPEKMSKKDRREHMREVARVRRAAELKRKKRNKVLTQVGVTVGSLAVIALVSVLIINSMAAANRPGPQNMLSDGFLLTGENGTVNPVTTAALESGKDPVATVPDPEKTNIVIYLDYLCPLCNQFEDANITGLQDMVGAGEATLEIHPLTMLDRLSLGTKYSTRSAAAMACVADNAPGSFLDASAALFAAQPAENTATPNNGELVKTLAAAGVDDPKVAACITDKTFESFVAKSSERAFNGPLPNTEVKNVTGTPTVLVNGIQYTPTQNVGWGDTNDFFGFVEQVRAQGAAK